MGRAGRQNPSNGHVWAKVRYMGKASKAWQVNVKAQAGKGVYKAQAGGKACMCMQSVCKAQGSKVCMLYTGR